jgi:hypothetical protein
MRLGRSAMSLGAILACALVSGCSETKCDGPLISCSNFTLEACGGVPGCKVGPGCELVSNPSDPSCSAAAMQADCSEPKCVWVNGACVDRCSTQPDRASCFALHSQDQDPASGAFTWSCFWTDCLGKPEKKSCDQFPVNMCPARFGCSVRQTCPLGDC